MLRHWLIAALALLAVRTAAENAFHQETVGFWQPDPRPGRNFIVNSAMDHRAEGWTPWGDGFEVRREADGNEYLFLANPAADGTFGAMQEVVLPEPEKGVWRFSCRTKNNGVKIGTSFPYYYALRVDAVLADGTSFHEMEMQLPRREAIAEWTTFTKTVHIPREVKSFKLYILLQNETGEVAFDDVKFELLEPEFEYFNVAGDYLGSGTLAVRAYAQQADRWQLSVRDADGKVLEERSGEQMPLRSSFTGLPTGRQLTVTLRASNLSNRKSWEESREVTLQPDKPAAELLLWTENSMERLYPSALPRRSDRLRHAELMLAQDEYEAFQLLALADRPVSNATLSFGEFTAADGAVLPAGAWEWFEVGYFFATDQLRYPGLPESIPDWTPDALLPVEASNIPADFAQSFWISCHLPEGVQPGVYRGTVTLAADGMAPQNIDVAVEALPFALPKRGSLPTSFTNHTRYWDSDHLRQLYDEKDFPTIYRHSDQFTMAHRVSPVSFWDEHLIDYDFDVAPYQDRLEAICLRDLNAPYIGYVWQPEKMKMPTEAELAEYRRKLQADVGPLVERMKQDGLLEYCYFIGFDEVALSKLPMVRAYFQIAKELFPEIPIISTLRIPRTDEAMKDIFLDDLVVFLPRYDLAEAEALRSQGHQVWAYVMASMADQYPQFNTHNPLIDSRILPWMAYQQRLDGLLYWGVNLWWPHKGEPFVDPAAGQFVNWSMYNNYSPWIHGDGRLSYPGPDGPIDSLRFYNFRDGLEDYEYLKLYEKAFGQAAAGELCREVVTGIEEYTKNPWQIYAVRRKLVETLMKEGTRE